MGRNRLSGERSPYLQSHADNPVDWYPWGEEAFKRAREEDRPIFLSIGYSTCHWCHVMERESFSDEDVARFMNRSFVPIKVDREERPDVDAVYMRACRVMTGSGGWPLTIIMAPDRKPFFAGTYIPRRTRFGRPGIMEVLTRMVELWKHERDMLLSSADSTMYALGQISVDEPGARIDGKVLRRAYRDLAGRFDPDHGGFGSAPKFPSPHILMFLLRYWKRRREDEALAMVERTLEAMARGGIWDHVGKGFHRYSTDRTWKLPHFEKMLYDQAMHVLAYIEAFQATGREIYGQRARDTLDFVRTELGDQEGGFWSAVDADSEGMEGRFYLWSPEELEEVLGPEEGGFVANLFNVTDGGNFREEATGRRNGLSVLHLDRPLEDLARERDLSVRDLEARWEGARRRLLKARDKRIAPAKDDKVLTDWNGLMMAALARAGWALDEGEYIDASRRCADFVLGNLRDSGGGLLHRYKDGEAGIGAYLDDHAFLVWGLLEVFQACSEPVYLESALEIVDRMVAGFWDPEVGGFYQTGQDHEDLPIRQKEIHDGAIPSGNSVAMYVLLRIGQLVHDPEAGGDPVDLAARTERAFAGSVRKGAAAHAFMLCAADLALGPSHELVIAGPEEGEDTGKMLGALRRMFLPRTAIIKRPTDRDTPLLDRLTNFTGQQEARNGRATAYLCRDHSCREPTTDIDEVVGSLSSEGAS